MESFLLTDAVALSSTHTQFGAGVDQIHLDGFGCNGSESNLTECSHGFTVSCSWYSRSAGVRCQGTKIKFIYREMEIYKDQIFTVFSQTTNILAVKISPKKFQTPLRFRIFLLKQTPLHVRNFFVKTHTIFMLKQTPLHVRIFFVKTDTIFMLKQTLLCVRNFFC